MSSYRFTPQAIDDLFEIWSYIASDDLDAANRVEEAIHVASAFLADTPLAGRIREDLTVLPLRFLACATLPELLDCVQSRNKTAAGHSHHSRGAGPSALVEVERKRSQCRGVEANRARISKVLTALACDPVTPSARGV